MAEVKYTGPNTLAQVIDNVKDLVENAADSKIDKSDIGVANGVAELDANGKVPSTQLPSYVDDIVDCYYDSETEKLYEHKDSTDPDNPVYSDEITPEGDKIYVDKDSNTLYRWTGSMLVSPGSANALTLGETSSTAYRGDRGKTAYDDSQTNKANIGTMTNLGTTEKTTLVGAINEVKTEVGGKVDKVTGKGLSTNDYNATEKAEVAKVKDKQNKTLTTAVTVDGVSKSSVEEAISALATLANLTATNHLNAIAVADVFDESVEYAIGDYCIKDNLLYKAKAVHEGAWDAADFDQKQIMAEIVSAMVSDYDSLLNQPQIAGNTLVGNKTYSELGIQQAISGKGLSTNDYTDEAKAIVDGVTTALATKQPKTLETAVTIEGGSKTTVQQVADAVSTHTGRSVTDNTGAHGLKVTAVSEDEDAIYYKSGNDWKQIQLGSVTQLAEMPTAAAKYVGNIYQFVGATTQDYKKGYFYECINSAGVYAWQSVRVQSGGGQTIQYDPLPTAEATLTGSLLQYIGTTNENYTKGHFYECVVGETAGTFVWKETNVSTEPTFSDEDIDEIIFYFNRGLNSRLLRPMAQINSIQDLKTMVKYYYDGVLNLNDYKRVWNVGDIFTFSITDIEQNADSYNLEAQPAQQIQMAIGDFCVDSLVTPINNRHEALITFVPTACLQNRNTAETNYASSNRKKWLENSFYNALDCKDIIKEVKKTWSYINNNNPSNFNSFNSKIWLLNSQESCGVFAAGNDSIRYKNRYTYYNNSANRAFGVNWFVRDRNEYMLSVNSSGTNVVLQNGSFGIAPGFCI